VARYDPHKFRRGQTEEAMAESQASSKPWKLKESVQFMRLAEARTLGRKGTSCKRQEIKVRTYSMCEDWY